MTPEELALAAYETEATARVAELRMRVHLLHRIAGDDKPAVVDTITAGDDGGAWAANAEYESLTDEQQEIIQELVLRDVRVRLWAAAGMFCSAAEALGISTDSISPEHVAIIAATVTPPPVELVDGDEGA